MISINDFFKIRLGYPVRLTKLGVYGLPVINWVNSNKAYIYASIEGNDVHFVLYEYDISTNGSTESTFKPDKIPFIITNSNDLHRFAYWAIRCAAKHMIRRFDAIECEDLYDTSDFNEWVIDLCESSAIEYFSILFCEFIKNTYSGEKLHDYLEKSDKIFPNCTFRPKYISYGEIYCDTLVRPGVLEIIKTINPYIRLVSREFIGGNERDIVVECTTRYFIMESIHQYISTNINGNEELWMEVSADRYDKFMGIKVKLDMTDGEYSLVNINDYLDALATKSIDNKLLLSLIKDTMVDTKTVYTRLDVYPENYEFTKMDATAAYLDYIYRYTRNLKVDKFLEENGYHVDIQRLRSKRSYRVTAVNCLDKNDSDENKTVEKDIFRIELGSVVRLTDYNGYGLRVENWINGGAAYIKTEIKEDRLWLQLIEVSGSRKNITSMKLNIPKFTMESIPAIVEELGNKLTELIILAANKNSMNNVMISDDKRVLWKTSRIMKATTIEFILFSLHEFVSESYVAKVYHLTDKFTERYIKYFLWIKYISFGEEYNGCIIRSETAKILSISFPYTRFISREFKWDTGEIDISVD